MFGGGAPRDSKSLLEDPHVSSECRGAYPLRLAWFNDEVAERFERNPPVSRQTFLYALKECTYGSPSTGA